MAVKLKRQYLVDNAGRKTAVVVSLNDFEELMEDLHDLAVIAERRSEKTIGMDELKRRLQAGSRLPCFTFPPGGGRLG